MERPDLDQEERLMRCVRRMGHLLCQRYNLNFSQKRIVLLLDREGSMTQKALTEHMDMKSASLSELLSKVIACGLVEKKRSEKDGRSFVLAVTEKGHEEAEAFRTRRRETAHYLFDILEDEEKNTLEDLLSRLMDHWQAEPAGTGDTEGETQHA